MPTILDLVFFNIKRILVENQFSKEENTHNAQQNIKKTKIKIKYIFSLNQSAQAVLQKTRDRT
jgi:hypothetical protein